MADYSEIDREYVRDTEALLTKLQGQLAAAEARAKAAEAALAVCARAGCPTRNRRGRNER